MSPHHQSPGNAGDASAFSLATALKPSMLLDFPALCSVMGVAPGGPTPHPRGPTLLSVLQSIQNPPHPSWGCSWRQSRLHSSLLPYWGAGGFFIIIPASFPFSFLLKAQKLVMIYLLTQRAEVHRQPQISGGTRVRLEQGHGCRMLCPGTVSPPGVCGVTRAPQGPQRPFFGSCDCAAASVLVVIVLTGGN